MEAASKAGSAGGQAVPARLRARPNGMQELASRHQGKKERADHEHGDLDLAQAHFIVTIVSPLKEAHSFSFAGDPLGCGYLR